MANFDENENQTVSLVRWLKTTLYYFVNLYLKL